MQLFNTLSAKQRADLISTAGEKRLTLSFYKYETISNPKLFRDHLFVNLNEIDVLGRIYIANEGINAQLSLPAKNFKKFRKFLNEIIFLKKVRLNVAIEHDNYSFLKLKIKLRNKIVADGLDNLELDLKKCGKHLDAKDFNLFIEKSETILIDMRNHYESEIGHFKGAVLPDVDSFRQSLPIIEKSLKKHKKSKNILMYCTGGIRCEKASTFLKHKGFKNVYQLKGGILNYLKKVKKKETLWKGECFVFDNRVSLKHNLVIGNYSICSGCRNPISTKDKKSNNYEEGVSCPRCHNKLTNAQKGRFRMRQKQINLAKEVGKKHIFQKEF